jgi:anti-sigma factor RsiW
MNDCPFQSRLSAFHDHELDPETAAKIAAHLATCTQCSQMLRGITAVSRLFSATSSAHMSQLGVARLHATADAAARRRDLFPSVFPLARALLAVAASVLVIAGAWLYEVPPTIRGPEKVVIHPEQPEADWEKLARGEKLGSPMEAGNETGVAFDFSKWMVESLKGDSGS